MHRILRSLLVFVFLAAAGFAQATDFAETKKKAEAGDAEAQTTLGNNYYQGKGVPKAITEALKWWLLAAEQGHSFSQLMQGMMYDNGEGVPKDSAEAVKWYRKAAEQGNAFAQEQLGYMYAEGKGVPKDLVQAHVWWNIAGAKGNADVKKNFKVAESKMTSAQKVRSDEASACTMSEAAKGKPRRICDTKADGKTRPHS